MMLHFICVLLLPPACTAHPEETAQQVQTQGMDISTHEVMIDAGAGMDMQDSESKSNLMRRKVDMAIDADGGMRPLQSEPKTSMSKEVRPHNDAMRHPSHRNYKEEEEEVGEAEAAEKEQGENEEGHAALTDDKQYTVQELQEAVEQGSFKLADIPGLTVTMTGAENMNKKDAVKKGEPWVKIEDLKCRVGEFDLRKNGPNGKLVVVELHEGVELGHIVEVLADCSATVQLHYTQKVPLLWGKKMKVPFSGSTSVELLFQGMGKIHKDVGNAETCKSKVVTEPKKCKEKDVIKGKCSVMHIQSPIISFMGFDLPDVVKGYIEDYMRDRAVDQVCESVSSVAGTFLE